MYDVQGGKEGSSVAHLEQKTVWRYPRSLQADDEKLAVRWYACPLLGHHW